MDRVVEVALMIGAGFICLVIIITPIIIPSSLIRADVKPNCDYYTKDGCMSSCSCSWCDGVNVCTDDLDKCRGANITLAEHCPPDYSWLYVAIGIICSLLALGTCFCVIGWCICIYSVYFHARPEFITLDDIL